MNSLKLIALFFATSQLSIFAQVTIQNVSYSAGQNITVSAPSTIAANTNVIVSPDAVIDYRTITRITLGPGFKAEFGSRFRAILLVDSDGDGMDDAWEVAHGLNPNVNDAGDDADNDGVSNLAEYQLGTNPGISREADSTNSILLNVQRPSL